MSPAFSFPPPPPPPPKATANITHPQSNSQNGSRGRGGRGNSRGAGRGPFPNHGQRSSQQSITRGQNQPSQDHKPNHEAWSNAARSSDASTTSNYFPGQGSISYTHHSGYNSTHSMKNRYQDPDSPEQQPTYTPPLFQKRKYEGSYVANTEQKSRAEKKPKVQPAPPVPMFGAPLPTFLKPSLSTSAEKTRKIEPDVRPKKQKEKRETNQLGLTPAGEDYEVSDEDIDEEATFASLGANSGNLLQFEYEGQVSTLSTPTELKAWIEQRRKHYPTQARVAERRTRAKELKETKEASRRKELEKTRQKVVESQQHKARSQTDKFNGDKDDKVRKKLEKHLAKADKLRRELRDVKQTSITTAPGSAASATSLAMESALKDDGERGSNDTDSQDDAGPEEMPVPKRVISDEQPDITSAETELLDKSISHKAAVHVTKEERLHSLLAQYGSDVSDLESSKSSSEESSVVSSSSDSDVVESKTIKRQETDNQPKLEPRHNSASVKHELPRGVCHHYYLNGRCSKGRSCRFKHVRSGSDNRPARKPVTESTKRQSLYQKLVAKEKEQENQTVLQAVKLLGDNGLLDDESQV